MVNYKNFHPPTGLEHLRYCTRRLIKERKIRERKKEKKSRDHVLGENGKSRSEDVAEDSSQKQCPSEGNREHHQESESTTTNLLALSFFVFYFLLHVITNILMYEEKEHSTQSQSYDPFFTAQW